VAAPRCRFDFCAAPLTKDPQISDFLAIAQRSIGSPVVEPSKPRSKDSRTLGRQQPVNRAMPSKELGRVSDGPLSVAVIRLGDPAEYLVCIGAEAWRRLNFQVNSVHSERCPHLSYPAQSWV